jgi:hypothetical protein
VAHPSCPHHDENDRDDPPEGRERHELHPIPPLNTHEQQETDPHFADP